MKSFYDLPLIGGLISQLNKDLTNDGLQEAMSKMIKRSHSRFDIKGKDKEVEDVLVNKRGVIVANHPYDAEVFALIASLPSRQDVYLIVNSRMMGVSPYMDKHLIPVYIDHHTYPHPLKKIIETAMRKYHPTKQFAPEEEHKKNIESLNIAAQKVKEGGLVIIFPGRRSDDGHWFNGVGHLLKSVGNSKDVYIVKTHIQGTSNFDYLRLLPLVGFFLPKIIVTFAPPLKLNEVWNDDPKQITRNLENLYNKWSNSF